MRAGFATRFHGVQDQLHLQCVGERRCGLDSGRDGGDQIDRLVSEAMFVTQTMARRPPVSYVRM
jgi:hypothetical protein